MWVVPMFLFAGSRLSTSRGINAPSGIWNGKQSMSVLVKGLLVGNSASLGTSPTGPKGWRRA